MLIALTAMSAHADELAPSPSPALRAAEARLDAAAQAVADLLAKEHGGGAAPARIELRVAREERPQSDGLPPPPGGPLEKGMIVLATDAISRGVPRCLPSGINRMHGPVPDEFPPPGSFTGVEMATISPSLGRYFGVAAGVLVTHVPTGMGLEDGDVVTRIGGRSVGIAERALQILDTYEPGELVPVTVTRHHAALELQLKTRAAKELGDH
jgi:S1-C subfamily serine protease